VELEEYVGAPSISLTVEKQQNAENKYTNELFERIIDRSAHQAILKCKEHMDKGYKWAVDIDLEKYFDTVNHDKLIGLVYKEVKDIRVSVSAIIKCIV
jgi:uncharacterized protein YajQ (UPF0234 family)